MTEPTDGDRTVGQVMLLVYRAAIPDYYVASQGHLATVTRRGGSVMLHGESGELLLAFTPWAEEDGND